MKAKRVVTENQILFAAMLQDQTLFMRHFWRADLTLPPSTRQKTFWNDESPRKLLCTGRKTAKTLYAEAVQVRYGIDHSAAAGAIEECMVTTPGDHQIAPIWDRVINRIDNNPLFRLFCRAHPKNEGKIEFWTGVIWYYRIDGSSGTDANMIGLRCKYIIGDEQALAVRVCHNSRKQSALPDCKWFYGGVPNGVRHTIFWELDQTRIGGDWSRYKFSTYVNPLYWKAKAFQTLKDDYGEGSQDYTTQVMGGWGEEVFSSFPPGSIAIDERLPYALTKLNNTDLPPDIYPLNRSILYNRLRIPRLNAAQYVIGMDYGFLQDPTEIVVAYREDVGGTTWKTCARIELTGCDPKAQARFLNILAEGLNYGMIGSVCLDQASGGLAVAMDLLNDSIMGQWWTQRLIDYNAGGTIEVDVITPETKAALENEGVVVPMQKKKVRRKQYAMQTLQLALINAKHGLEGNLKLWLASDAELVQELIDTREKKTEGGYTVYVPRMDSGNRPIDHITDALRTLVLACQNAQVREEMETGDEVEYVEMDLFGGRRMSEGNTSMVRRAFQEAGY